MRNATTEFYEAIEVDFEGREYKFLTLGCFDLKYRENSKRIYLFQIHR